jgi:hypothetical protein
MVEAIVMNKTMVILVMLRVYVSHDGVFACLSLHLFRCVIIVHYGQNVVVSGSCTIQWEGQWCNPSLSLCRKVFRVPLPFRFTRLAMRLFVLG